MLKPGVCLKLSETSSDVDVNTCMTKSMWLVKLLTRVLKVMKAKVPMYGMSLL